LIKPRESKRFGEHVTSMLDLPRYGIILAHARTSCLRLSHTCNRLEHIYSSTPTHIMHRWFFT